MGMPVRCWRKYLVEILSQFIRLDRYPRHWATTVVTQYPAWGPETVNSVMIDAPTVAVYVSF